MAAIPNPGSGKPAAFASRSDIETVSSMPAPLPQRRATCWAASRIVRRRPCRPKRYLSKKGCKDDSKVMQFGGISTRLKTCVHRSCLPKVGFHPRHPEGAKTEVLYGTQTSEGSLAPEPRARGTRPGPGVRGLGPGPGAGGPGRGPGPRGPRRPGPRHRPGPKDVGQVPGLIRSRHTPPGLGRRRAVLRLRRVLWRARKPWWQGLAGT